MSNENQVNPEELQEEASAEEVEEVVEADAMQEEVENDTAGQEEEPEADTALAEAQAKIDEIEDQNIRLQAEIQNLQRRNRLDREDAAKFRSQKLAEALIPAVDNLERVLDVEIQTEEGERIKKGIDMVLASFYAAFESESIEVLDPKGQSFDPNVHEAVTMIEAEKAEEAGTIAEVLSKGYVLNGRTLRAAQVVVYQ